MECVNVCDDENKIVHQTEASVASNKEDTKKKKKKYNHLTAWKKKSDHWKLFFLNKDAYLNFASGACLGCSEESLVHLFTATVESLMQPRIEGCLHLFG